MTHLVVTRGSQITLTRDVRQKLGVKEGDTVTVNTIGRVAVIAKRDPTVWRSGGRFLPPRPEEAMSALRADSTERLRRLGLA